MTTSVPSLERWLSAAEPSARLDPWENPEEFEYAAPAVTERPAPTTLTAVLTVTGLPRQLRPKVESAMVVCIPSTSELTVPASRILTAEWFTGWHRDRTTGPENGEVLVGCRQLLTGTTTELDRLRRVVEGLAREYRFSAEVRIVD